MEEVTAFKASNGTLFDDRAVCEEYEAGLAWGTRIDEFAKSSLSPYQGGSHVHMQRKAIIAWERFKVLKAPLVAIGACQHKDTVSISEAEGDRLFACRLCGASKGRDGVWWHAMNDPTAPPLPAA